MSSGKRSSVPSVDSWARTVWVVLAEAWAVRGSMALGASTWSSFHSGADPEPVRAGRYSAGTGPRGQPAEVEDQFGGACGAWQQQQGETGEGGEGGPEGPWGEGKG